MHVLFLIDNFPPEVNAPASRTFEHCRAWVRSGHQVTVITCAPNFPKGQGIQYEDVNKIKFESACELLFKPWNKETRIGHVGRRVIGVPFSTSGPRT